MYTRYLSKKFFIDHYRDAVEIIDYYDLDNLVYCTNLINVDRSVEFYNNLINIDNLTYTTRLGGRTSYLL